MKMQTIKNIHKKKRSFPLRSLFLYAFRRNRENAGNVLIKAVMKCLQFIIISLL